jgi:hypothetical protein
VKTLPDHLELLGVDIERAARDFVRKRRQRRRRVQLAALVATTAVVGTSAGLGASGVNVLDWLWPDDPSAVRYVPDESRAYTGIAPLELECPSVGGESFTCCALPGVPEEPRKNESEGGMGWSFECQSFRAGRYPCGEPGRSQRIYMFSERVVKAPSLTRESLLRAIDDAEEKGFVAPDEADEFRDAVNDVGDDFFVKYSRLTTVGGFDTYEEGPTADTERIPPAGVPMFVTCEGGARAAMQCRPLDEVATLRVGTPIYRLLPTEDWVTIPRTDQTPEQRWKAFEALWGGPLTPEEARLFFLMDETLGEVEE